MGKGKNDANSTKNFSNNSLYVCKIIFKRSLRLIFLKLRHATNVYNILRLT